MLLTFSKSKLKHARRPSPWTLEPLLPSSSSSLSLQSPPPPPLAARLEVKVPLQDPLAAQAHQVEAEAGHGGQGRGRWRCRWSSRAEASLPRRRSISKPSLCIESRPGLQVSLPLSSLTSSSSRQPSCSCFVHVPGRASSLKFFEPTALRWCSKATPMMAHTSKVVKQEENGE